MTSDQRKQILRLLEDRLDRINPTDKVAQRVIMRGGEFGDGVQELFRGLSTTDQFKDEEVESRVGYLSGYTPGVKDLSCQITVLQMQFPGLGDTDSEYLSRVKSGSVKLPGYAEKFVAIPNWKKRPELFGKGYSDAFLIVLGKLKVHNFREGKINSQTLRKTKRTAEQWDKMIEEQGNPDILIVPIQFGFLHRGRSVRRAREVFLENNEFSLGAFAVGILLLTHPERLQHLDDLWIDCAGDEFDDPVSDVRFDRAPYFYDDKVQFGTGVVSNALDIFGSTSWFPPQSE